MASVALVPDHVRPLDYNGPVDVPFREVPRAWLDRSIFDVFSETAARFADKTAISDGDTRFTFAEVRERALALAARIVRIVEPGAPVGVALPVGAKCPIAELALTATGCPFVPLDPAAPEVRTAHIVRHSGMRAIIVDHEARGTMLRIAGELPLVDFDEMARGAAPALKSSADDAAYIIYTSGSEGVPKGVYHSHRTHLHYVLQQTNSEHISHEDQLLMLVGPLTIIAQKQIFTALLTGATLHVLDLHKKGHEVADTIKRQRITLLEMMPSVFRRFVGAVQDRAVFDTVRAVLFGADRILSSDIELFRERFPARAVVNAGMGSTETKRFCQWHVPRDWPVEGPFAPVGYVTPDHEVTLRDDDDAPVPTGEVGEIVIKSRYIALGYWKNEEATRAKFSPAPDDPAARIFRTGDLGRFRPDGLMELIGRKDRQIKVRAQRVEPAEIEMVIRNHPAVRDAAVIARRTGDSHAVIAYIVADPGAALTSKALAEFLATRLTDAMRPREIHFLSSIPMLGNFKQDILALEEIDRRNAGA
jgi:amino acid adenylation domain-containing protein